VADTFTGFPPAGTGFLGGLAADNSRAYFDANRGSYANDVAAPLRALVIAVGERLRDTAVPDLCFDPSVGKSLFRINRDTRFSADKTPYHPWADAIWWAGPGDAPVHRPLSSVPAPTTSWQAPASWGCATYPQDHPRRDLLRCDTLHASLQRAHPPTLASPAFADTLTGLLTPFAPLHRWLVDHVAT